jgi:hypothetical protein
MADADRRRRLLSPYQARALREYERVLEAMALNPERVLDFAEDDPPAVTPVIRSMTDQLIRGEVIFEYSMIDMELDHLLFRHFFGSGNRLTRARASRRYRTLRQLLQNLYPLQKLAIVRTFKTVPKPIVSKIAAINELRNGLAHTFFLDDLPLAKRTYKGVSILKRQGLVAFQKDAWEVRCFFNPWLAKWFPEGSDDAA